MHGEDFQGFKNINTVRLCFFIHFWAGWARWQFPVPSGGGRKAVLSSRHVFPREFLSLTWTRGMYRWKSICSKYCEISRSSRLHVFGWKKFLLKREGFSLFTKTLLERWTVAHVGSRRQEMKTLVMVKEWQVITAGRRSKQIPCALVWIMNEWLFPGSSLVVVKWTFHEKWCLYAH